MLSGGEQQRAAIAVALANLPPLILADEPTAELDSSSAKLVLAAFRAACREFRTTIVMVTHDLLAAERADRTMRLLDGRIRHEARPAQLDGGRVTLPWDALDALAGADGELQVEVSEGEVHLRRKRGRNG
jgi:ABC-type phosphate/phosphonate transport system ATPase subunit